MEAKNKIPTLTKCEKKNLDFPLAALQLYFLYLFMYEVRV